LVRKDGLAPAAGKDQLTLGSGGDSVQYRLASRRRRYRAAVLFGFGSLLIAACSSSASSSGSSPPSAASEKARSAGYAMTADHVTAWAVVAAKAVAGRHADTVIDVMRAEGSTLRGRVVLRLNVQDNGGTFAPEDAICVEYRFVHTRLDGEPRQLPACPGSAPLDLSRIPGYPGVSPAIRDRIKTLLDGLPGAERVNAAAVREYLASRLGLGYFVQTHGEASGVLVQVYSGTQCVSADATRTDVSVGRPAHGTDCLGG
jgi:hypothetical protein